MANEIEFQLIDLGSGWESASYAHFIAAAGTDYATQPVYFEDLRPAGVEPQIPRITDMAGAVKEFGLEIDTSLGWTACPEGKACWKLVGIRFRTGVAATIPLIIGPNGLPNPNICVYENWPDAPDQPVTPTPPYYTNYVGGFTNGDGVLGFGYGGGGVVGANGGPFNVWPSNAPSGLEPQYADCLKKIGWRGDTDHMTPSGVWAYTVKPSVTSDPTPTPGGSGCLVAVIEAILKSLKGA